MSDGKMHIHNPKLMIDFLQSIPTQEEIKYYEESTLPKHQLSEKALEEQLMKRRKLAAEEQKRKFVEKKRTLFKQKMERQKKMEKTALIEKEKKSARRFEQMYEDLMNERKERLPRVNELLYHYGKFKEERKEDIYNHWNETKYKPIQKKITSKVNKMDIRESERRKYLLFQKYLDESNRKVGIFRDIVIPEDYDPFEAHSYNIKYKTRIKKKNLSPTTSKDNNEHSRHQKKQRKMLDTKFWGKGNIESTPHGRYSFQNRYNPLNFKKKDNLLTKTNPQRLGLDHFHYPKGNDFYKSGKKMNTNGNNTLKKTKTFSQMISGFEYNNRNNNKNKSFSQTQ